MREDVTDEHEKGTDREAHIAIVGNRMFQTRDEKKIRRLEKAAAKLAKSGQYGVGIPGGVEVMGPDQVDDSEALDIDKETPTAK